MAPWFVASLGFCMLIVAFCGVILPRIWDVTPAVIIGAVALTLFAVLSCCYNPMPFNRAHDVIRLPIGIAAFTAWLVVIMHAAFPEAADQPELLDLRVDGTLSAIDNTDREYDSTAASVLTTALWFLVVVLVLVVWCCKDGALFRGTPFFRSKDQQRTLEEDEAKHTIQLGLENDSWESIDEIHEGKGEVPGVQLQLPPATGARGQRAPAESPRTTSGKGAAAVPVSSGSGVPIQPPSLPAADTDGEPEPARDSASAHQIAPTLAEEDAEAAAIDDDVHSMPSSPPPSDEDEPDDDDEEEEQEEQEDVRPPSPPAPMLSQGVSEVSVQNPLQASRRG